VRAGNDVNVTGSNVVSTQGTGVAAGNNVNIVAAVDQSTQNNYRQETTSGDGLGLPEDEAADRHAEQRGERRMDQRAMRGGA
jgi:hypothetical protein